MVLFVLIALILLLYMCVGLGAYCLYAHQWRGDKASGLTGYEKFQAQPFTPPLLAKPVPGKK